VRDGLVRSYRCADGMGERTECATECAHGVGRVAAEWFWVWVRCGGGDAKRAGAATVGVGIREMDARGAGACSVRASLLQEKRLFCG
jgi:hypothetical protein